MDNTNNKKGLFPLAFAKENESFRISSLRGGQQFRNKCVEQGIIPGQQVLVVNSSGGGSCVLKINNSRIMIGNGMLMKIIVEKE